MLFDANDNPIESTAELKKENEGYDNVPSFNFPPPTPKPEWFDRKLLEIGGYVPGTETPKYRVVWGMSEKQYAMGELHMKYITIIDTIQTTLGYNVINSRSGARKFVSAKKAIARFQDPHTKEFTRNIRPGELIVPVIKEETREIGLPLWVAEYYMEPEGFGGEEAWEAERWLINPEKPTQYIDVLGAYPKQGAYVEWFQLYDLDDDGKPIYRELDEGALELIRANHVLNVVRRKNMVYDTPDKRRERRDTKFDEDWADFDRDMTVGMLDIKKNRKFNTPGISNPGRG